MRLTALEKRVDALESGAVSSATGSPLSLSSSTLASALESFGAFISKGIAQFNTLVADQFVAATNSAGTSSAGTVTILAGNTVAQVDNAYVLPSSKIFVTFTASTTGSWHISDKQVGSFKVVLSEAQSADTSFDYFLVQTEGQLQTSDAGASETGSLTPSSVFRNLDSSVSPVITTIPSPPPTSTSTPDGSQTSEIVQHSVSPTSDVGADTIAPVVTLVGDAALQITVGDTFTDPGATASDDTDGDLTSSIVETASPEVQLPVSSFQSPDLYTLTYTATDAAGNVASVSRVVTVIAPPPATEPVPAPPTP